VDVVRHLLAVQAQDLGGARLAVRARSCGLSAGDVDDAFARHELVVTWLQRGTLHLVRAEDYWWLHPLTAPRTRTAVARRLQQEGVSRAQTEIGLATVAEAIAAEGPRTRAQLKARLDDAGVPTAGQALIYVLAAASLAGLVVRGPMVGGDQAYVLVEEWLGSRPASPDRAELLAKLAGRYLAAHAVSGAAELAAWAGITLKDARVGMAEFVRDDAVPDDAVPDDAVPDVGVPEPRLLGPFDPVLHGWTERAWLLGPYRNVITTNGIFRPTVLVGGRVVGTWTRPRGQVELDLFEKVRPDVRRALDADAEDVDRFVRGAGPPPG
jgi:hypothetical protein